MPPWKKLLAFQMQLVGYAKYSAAAACASCDAGKYAPHPHSMPRRRRTQTSAVRSLTQPRGRLAANQAASGTSQHHSTPSKYLYTHRPTHRLTSSLQRPFLLLLVALRNTVLSWQEEQERSGHKNIVSWYACRGGLGGAQAGRKRRNMRCTRRAARQGRTLPCPFELLL